MIQRETTAVRLSYDVPAHSSTAQARSGVRSYLSPFQYQKLKQVSPFSFFMRCILLSLLKIGATFVE